MTDYAVACPPQPALPVLGAAALFPVRRIYCVGRNYAAHAREMGHDPDREDPFFFQKSPDSIVLPGGNFPYPPGTSDVHHEIELVVALGLGGANIPEDQALDHIFGYGVGLDMTRRDLQGEAKKAGRPWTVGKAFDHAAPCSAITPARAVANARRGRIWLDINGDSRQDGDIDQLIWSVPEIIAYLSGLFTLAPGDLIYTGTPAGVGPVERGDNLRGGIDGIGEIEITVV